MSHQTEREVKLLMARAGVDLAAATGARRIRQVYLLSGRGTVRVRAYDPEGAAAGPEPQHELTVKFDLPGDASSEYTQQLAPDEGARMYAEALRAGFPEVAKTRYFMPAEGEGMDGLAYELDVFEGRFDFLTLAELEYTGPTRPAGLATRPSWYREGPWGVDVTAHGGFRNSRLVGLDPPAIEALRQEFDDLLAAGADAA